MPELTLRFGAGLDSDSPPLAAEPLWRNGNRMRFRGGAVEPIGGWTRLIAASAPAAIRGLYRWDAVDEAGRRAQLAVGTARGLYACVADSLWDITPLRLERVLAAGAVTGAVGSAQLSIAWPAHGAAVGDLAYLDVSLLPEGPWSTALIQQDPVSTQLGSTEATYRLPGHGLRDGDMLRFVQVEAVGGVEIAGQVSVRVLDADRLAFHLDSPAGASETGGGWVIANRLAGLPILATPNAGTLAVQLPLVLDAPFASTGSQPCFLPLAGTEAAPAYATGWSTGGYGTGNWGGVGAPAEAREARLWSFAAWGRNLLAAPRGGTLYEWALNPSRRAVAVAGAPERIGWMTVTAQRSCMCFGASAADGPFDPLLIRWSDIEDNSSWTPDIANNAGQLRLGSGSRILRGLQSAGQVLLWTDRGLHGLSFTGDSGSVYALNALAEGCGLAGPLAVAEWRGSPVWLTPQKTVLRLDGGLPVPIPCPVDSLAFAALAEDRLDLVSAGTVSAAGELWFLLPGVGENARPRAAFLNAAGGWSLAELDRSVLLDTPDGPVMGDEAGVLWLHEQAAAGADGAPLNAWVDSSPVVAGAAAATFLSASADLTRAPLTLTLRCLDNASLTERSARSLALSPAAPSGPLRITGRLVALRLASVAAAGIGFRCAGVRLDAVAAGRRI